MKKTLVTLTLSAVVLAGCQAGTWDVKRDPNLPESYYQTQQQLLSTAKETLKKTPADFNAQFEIAYRYHLLGKLKDAVKEYEKALALAPADFATLNNLAAIYEEVKEYSNAAKYIKTLYENNPASSEVIADTVRILLENNEPEAAVQALENFVKILREDSKNSKNKTSENDLALVSNLYQSIDTYKKQHANK